jgi:hypothetical protein
MGVDMLSEDDKRKKVLSAILDVIERETARQLCDKLINGDTLTEEQIEFTRKKIKNSMKTRMVGLK